MTEFKCSVKQEVRAVRIAMTLHSINRVSQKRSDDLPNGIKFKERNRTSIFQKYRSPFFDAHKNA